MRERALGGEHPEVAAALNNLAVLLRAVDMASSGLHLHAQCAFRRPPCRSTGMRTLLRSVSLESSAIYGLKEFFTGRH